MVMFNPLTVLTHGRDALTVGFLIHYCCKQLNGTVANSLLFRLSLFRQPLILPVRYGVGVQLATRCEAFKRLLAFHRMEFTGHKLNQQCDSGKPT
jgi:hypothetical protein